MSVKTIEQIVISIYAGFNYERVSFFLFTVFGWIQGEMFFQPERTATYMLQAGFIKGGAVQTFVTSSTLARFEVVIEDGSAGK